MVTQRKQPDAGVNPGNKGPAQPQNVEDPHPDNEEGYRRERHPGGDRDEAGGKRPSDTDPRSPA